MAEVKQPTIIEAREWDLETRLDQMIAGHRVQRDAAMQTREKQLVTFHQGAIVALEAVKKELEG